MQIRVKVKPGSRTDAICLADDGTLEVKIRARPVENAANLYLEEFLAGVLSLRRSDVRIEKGTTSRLKTVWINLTHEEFTERLNKFDT
jgi:uncharacterized protein YggU (UPF0235/DUF167 family)